MDSQPQKDHAGLIKAYNRVVRWFKEVWSVFRAVLLIHSGDTEDLAKARQHIRELQKKIAGIEKTLRTKDPAAGPEGLPERLKMIHIELRVFRELLEKIESRVGPAEIRQYFQKTPEIREEEIIQVIRFYLEKSTLSEMDTDKVDLLVTEACSTRIGFRRVLRPPFEVDGTFTRIFDRPAPVSEYEDAILHEFESAAGRIRNARDVDEIIRDEIISTMRKFKKEIIELFRNPRILRAALQYNIALNNKLVDIFENEEGVIMKAAELASNIKKSLPKLSAGQRQTADGLIAKVREIQDAYAKKRGEASYDLELIIEAARQRKAIEESVGKLREIGGKEEEKPVQESFRRRTIQAYINEIFHGLLQLDTLGYDSMTIYDLNIDLSKMDPWEKSLFLMDTQSLGDDRRPYEALREAIVMRSKITEEYKMSKRHFDRPGVESVLAENLEVAEHLDKELQGLLDNYNRRTHNYNAIDVMKVKSGLSRSIQRLKTMARMEGYKAGTK